MSIRCLLDFHAWVYDEHRLSEDIRHRHCERCGSHENQELWFKLSGRWGSGIDCHPSRRLYPPLWLTTLDWMLPSRKQEALDKKPWIRLRESWFPPQRKPVVAVPIPKARLMREVEPYEGIWEVV